MRHRSRLVFVLAAFSIALTPGFAAPLAATGLSSFRSAFFTEDETLFLGPENDDEFGDVLASGDFNCDGVDDLALGVPGDDNVGGLYPDSGIAYIRFGAGGAGLGAGAAEQVLSQAFGGSPDPAEPDDRFGGALAAGDFDGDGCADLAVGIPNEDDADEDDTNSGAVQVYTGSPTGLDLASALYFDEDTDGVPGGTAEGDHFGTALAAGDFDGDGYDDLAIGVPWEDIGFAAFGCGSVNVLYGTAAGLATDSAQRFHQDSPLEMDGSCEVVDVWGSALAAADFDADGFTDLAVGAPGENDGGGGVHFIFGTDDGLGADRNNLWTQNDGGVLDTDELGDSFGDSLAAGDFTGDGYADLVIGVPFEDLELGGGGVLVDAGAFHVFFGSATGITSAGSLFWTQSNAAPGVSEAGELWSIALAAGDFDADGFADVAVGAPREGLAAGAWVGEVTVLRGYSNGLLPTGTQRWSQNSAGVPGSDEQGDEFARALAVGDFDGSGHADLAIGAPRESTVAFGNGAAWVLYGSLFSDGFESGSTGAWSSDVP